MKQIYKIPFIPLVSVSYLCSLLLLSSCMPGASQTARFYNLKTESNFTISETYKNSVGILRIQIPKFMDKPQIISQNKGNPEVNISEYNRWVEPLSVLYTRTLVENLSVLLPNAPIKMSTRDDSFNRVILVDIVKLDTSWQDKGILEAWYTIKTRNGQVLASKKFSDSITMGNSYEDLVKTHSKLLGNLSKAIANTLTECR